MKWFKREAVLEPVEEEVVSLTNQETFAAHLLKELAASREGNLLVSPFSVWSCLALLVPGAQGETRRALSRTLGLPEDLAGQEWSTEVGNLISDLKSRGLRCAIPGDSGSALDLIVANAVWLQVGYTLREDYLSQVTQGLGADAQGLDFAGNPGASCSTINDWAGNNTRGRIKEVLSDNEIHALTRLILTNATYFKDDWLEKFHLELTKPQIFHRRDRSRVKVPMMPQMEEFGYFEDRTLQAVRLPYVHDDLSMTVVLPKRIDRFEATLTPESLDRLFRSVRGLETVILLLPKVELRDDLRLVPALRSLGLEHLFGTTADLTGVTAEPGVYIDEVKHLTFVKIDEKGTEAAAVSAAVMLGAAPAPVRRKPKTMKVDRPFWFFIRDDRSGLMLFAGRVEDPS